VVPFYWTPSGGFIALALGATSSDGFDINDSNYVTGVLDNQAFIWAPRLNRPIYLGSLSPGGSSIGVAINKHQLITGTAVSNGIWHAFVWSRYAGMLDIGAIAGVYYTSGRAINASNEVVGFGGVPYTAFYWTRAGGMVTMQTLGGGEALAIDMNDGGAITGYSTVISGATHAAVWPDHTSAPQDLGTLPGETNSYGYSINSVGQVAGYAEVP